MEISNLHIKIFLLVSLVFHSGLFVALSNLEQAETPISKKPIVVKLKNISKSAAVVQKAKKSEPKKKLVKKSTTKKRPTPKKAVAKRKAPKPIKKVEPVKVPTPPKLENKAPVVSPVAVTNYESLILAKLEENKYYPRTARKRGLEGLGEIRIKLARDGRVLDYKLEKSFGYKILDKAIAKMVRRSAPFPAFPKTINRDSFEFVVPIEFALKK